MKKRRYKHGQAEFILEPLSDSLVKDTHREQAGHIGISKNWNAAKPYTWTYLVPGGGLEGTAKPEGIEGNPFSHPTPEEALIFLCKILLDLQSKEDSKRINPEERKHVARQVFREFLEGLPE